MMVVSGIGWIVAQASFWLSRLEVKNIGQLELFLVWYPRRPRPKIERIENRRPNRRRTASKLIQVPGRQFGKRMSVEEFFRSVCETKLLKRTPSPWSA